MNTQQALAELGLKGNELSEEQRAQFDQEGFVILPKVFSREQCKAFAAEFDRLSAIEGAEGGREVHTETGAPRLSNILNKTSVYDVCLRATPILAAAYHLLGEMKLHGANMRDPLRGQGHQDLHSDSPKEFLWDWRVANALIPFDDMDAENGATRVVPKSHLWPALSGHTTATNVTDKSARAEDLGRLPTDRSAPYQGEIKVELEAGSTVVINGALWHGGTLNVSGRQRRMLHLSFTRRELPQQLVQQAFLTAALYDRLTPALRYILDVTAPKVAA
jgi:ectoine hydroxylase-related dioxygenase (phytanoyl-CoA dioxygenase family)